MITGGIRWVDLDALNERCRTYVFPKYQGYGGTYGGGRPNFKADIKEGTIAIDGDGVRLRQPDADCGLKMSAGQVATWTVHSIALLGPLIAGRLDEYRGANGQREPEWWYIWKLCVSLFNLVLSRATGDVWSKTVSKLVVELQEKVLAYPTFSLLFKKKMHFISHVSVEGLEWGPISRFWNMLLEGFHQPHKRAAEASNHKDLLYTVVEDYSERSGLLYYHQTELIREDAVVVGAMARDSINIEDPAAATAPDVAWVYSRAAAAAPKQAGAAPVPHAVELLVDFPEAVRFGGRVFSLGAWVIVSSREPPLVGRLAKIHRLYRSSARGMFSGYRVYAALTVYAESALRQHPIQGHHFSTNSSAVRGVSQAPDIRGEYMELSHPAVQLVLLWRTPNSPDTLQPAPEAAVRFFEI